MRIFFTRLAAALIFGLASTGGAAAMSNPDHLPPYPHITGYVFHPWCYDGTGNESGVPICAYDSYAQCMENAGQCVLSPYFGWPERPKVHAMPAYAPHYRTRAGS